MHLEKMSAVVAGIN